MPDTSICCLIACLHFLSLSGATTYHTRCNTVKKHSRSMKAVSAAKKANGVQPAAPPPQQRANQPIDVADPMLQGTYVSQDEIGSCGEDLESFEAKLLNPSSSNRASAPRPKVTTGVANTAAKIVAPPATKPQPSQLQQQQLPSRPKAVGGTQQPISEEEEERLQDIQDVRDLKVDDESSSDDD